MRGAAFAADLKPWIAGRPVLEVGVGTAAVAKPLADALGGSVCGVDLSPRMLAQAYQRLGATVAVCDAQALPVATERVSTVLFVRVLQAIGDGVAAIAEAARVLRQGGRLLALLAGQGPHDAEDMTALMVDWWAALGRPRPDTVERIAAASEAAGLALLGRTLTTEQEWYQCPTEAAERIEQRQFGPLFDLDDKTFAQVIRPIADALRRLPRRDVPRWHAATHPLLVWTKRE